MIRVILWGLAAGMVLQIAAPAQGQPGDPVRVGMMPNAYTCISRFTNQVGYDHVSDWFTIIFRGGPYEEYPNQGSGSLVLNSTSDRGITWSGNSPIFNEEVPGNIEGRELAARHPNIFLQNEDGTIHVASLWSTMIQTPRSPEGTLGEPGYKAGALGGPYQSGVLPCDEAMHYFPSRIISDMDGRLFSLVQLRDAGNETFTGSFACLSSTDKGATWLADYQHPALRLSSLPFKYQYTEEAISMDVSPDGTTLYIGFVAYLPGADTNGLSLDYSATQFGWVRSTDAGQTWSNPVLAPFASWNIAGAPAGSVDQTNGFVYPSIATVVDGLNQPHFLVSVNGGDKAIPPDSTLIGELILNTSDPTGPPEFFTLAENKLPQFNRFFSPTPSWLGPQPKQCILSEPEWAKTPDGMVLVAKWIDADSVLITTYNGHPLPQVRDSVHDVYLAIKDQNRLQNGRQGWYIDNSTNGIKIINISQSPSTDEKFTKMPPFIHPLINITGVIYTIMAGSEFQPYYPDIDDQGPSGLFFLSYLWRIPDVWPNAVPGISSSPDFSLAQNYPNPVTRHSGTNIGFSLEKAANVRITVYDLLGRPVGTPTEGHREPGTYNERFSPGDLPAGLYIYRLETGGNTTSRIMSIVK